MAETIAETGSAKPLQGADPWTPPEGPLERACQALCGLVLVVMVVMIGVEVISRALFHYSFEISDELGGYGLVAISFLSLPVAQVNHGFHHVDFVQAWLSPRGRAISRLAFDLLCLCCVAILLWQLARLELGTWRSGNVASTLLATPLWLPQLSMPLGSAVLFLTLLRTVIADFRRLAARGDGAAPPGAR